MSDKRGVFDRAMNYYDREYKKLLFIPIVLLLLSFIIIGTNYAQTGEFFQKGVSLKGGTTLSVFDITTDIIELEAYLSEQFPDLDVYTRSLTKAGAQVGIIVEASTQDSSELINAVELKIGELSKDQYTVDTTGPSLGKAFFAQAIFAVILAFLFMAVVVYIYFRAALPCSYIIFAAIADIIFALAMVNVFNIKLTTAGVAAFLMLIGYSVDTDILLTTRILKRKEGTIESRVRSSISTGLTMTFAAIAATVVAYYSTQSEIMKQIMFILFWGLVADIINTWFTNVGLLRWYVEKKSR
ncbi:protein translocase subunit SecF [Nanoarchaeota archaeon]